MGGNRKYSIEEEERIIKRAQKDHRVFGLLYDAYFKQIYLFVLKRVADENLSGELCSTIFLKALTKLPSYKCMGYPFSSWLYRIAINEINMHYRASKKTQTVEIQVNDASVVMQEIEIHESGDTEIEQMLEALSKLKEPDQRLIELRFFDKCSFKEMAVILGISAGNAKIKTYRALDKLKKEMGA